MCRQGSSSVVGPVTWELCLTGSANLHNRVSYHLLLAWEKIKIWSLKCGFYWVYMVNIPLQSCQLSRHKLGTIHILMKGEDCKRKKNGDWGKDLTLEPSLKQSVKRWHSFSVVAALWVTESDLSLAVYVILEHDINLAGLRWYTTKSSTCQVGLLCKAWYRSSLAGSRTHGVCSKWSLGWGQQRWWETCVLRVWDEAVCLGG